MRKRQYLIIFIAIIILIGCTGGRGTKYVPQTSDTLYTEAAAMDVYGTQPERALVIIDSAEIVGNLTGDRASLLRAKVFCLTCGEEQLDTARQICEALLQSDYVQEAPDNRESVLTAANAIESSKADVHDRDLGVYLSNAFSRTFRRTVETFPHITIYDLYRELFKTTQGSHVSIYNQKQYGSVYTEDMGEFLN